MSPNKTASACCFDCRPSDCLYCGKAESQTGGFGPFTTIQCSCCAVKCMHVACMQKAGRKVGAEVLEPNSVCVCSEIYDQWTAKTGQRLPLKDDPEFSLEVVKYKEGDPVIEATIDTAVKIFRSSFRMLLMDNGRDLIEMVCQGYESPPDGEDEDVDKEDGGKRLTRAQKAASGSQERDKSSQKTTAHRGKDKDESDEDGDSDGSVDSDDSDDEDEVFSFGEFRVLVLRKEDVIVTVATVRIFGPHFAEMPFISTRAGCRRAGNCRRLVRAVDDMLAELGIKYLVLPSVTSVLPMWISKFGFSELTEQEHEVLVVCDIVDMDPDTTHLVKRCVGQQPILPPAKPTETDTITLDNSRRLRPPARPAATTPVPPSIARTGPKLTSTATAKPSLHPQGAAAPGAATASRSPSPSPTQANSAPGTLSRVAHRGPGSGGAVAKPTGVSRRAKERKSGGGTAAVNRHKAASRGRRKGPAGKRSKVVSGDDEPLSSSSSSSSESDSDNDAAGDPSSESESESEDLDVDDLEIARKPSGPAHAQAGGGRGRGGRSGAPRARVPRPIPADGAPKPPRKVWPAPPPVHMYPPGQIPPEVMKQLEEHAVMVSKLQSLHPGATSRAAIAPTTTTTSNSAASSGSGAAATGTGAGDGTTSVNGAATGGPGTAAIPAAATVATLDKPVVVATLDKPVVAPVQKPPPAPRKRAAPGTAAAPRKRPAAGQAGATPSAGTSSGVRAPVASAGLGPRVTAPTPEQERVRRRAIRQADKERKAARRDTVLAITLAESVKQALMGKQSVDVLQAELARMRMQLTAAEDHNLQLQNLLQQHGITPPPQPGQPPASANHHTTLNVLLGSIGHAKTPAPSARALSQPDQGCNAATAAVTAGRDSAVGRPAPPGHAASTTSHQAMKAIEPTTPFLMSNQLLMGRNPPHNPVNQATLLYATATIQALQTIQRRQLPQASGQGVAAGKLAVPTTISGAQQALPQRHTTAGAHHANSPSQHHLASPSGGNLRASEQPRVHSPNDGQHHPRIDRVSPTPSPNVKLAPESQHIPVATDAAMTETNQKPAPSPHQFVSNPVVSTADGCRDDHSVHAATGDASQVDMEQADTFDDDDCCEYDKLMELESNPGMVINEHQPVQLTLESELPSCVGCNGAVGGTAGQSDSPSHSPMACATVVETAPNDGDLAKQPTFTDHLACPVNAIQVDQDAAAISKANEAEGVCIAGNVSDTHTPGSGEVCAPVSAPIIISDSVTTEPDADTSAAEQGVQPPPAADDVLGVPPTSSETVGALVTETHAPSSAQHQAQSATETGQAPLSIDVAAPPMLAPASIASAPHAAHTSPAPPAPADGILQPVNAEIDAHNTKSHQDPPNASPTSPAQVTRTSEQAHHSGSSVDAPGTSVTPAKSSMDQSPGDLSAKGGDGANEQGRSAPRSGSGKPPSAIPASARQQPLQPAPATSNPSSPIASPTSLNRFQNLFMNRLLPSVLQSWLAPSPSPSPTSPGNKKRSHAETHAADNTDGARPSKTQAVASETDKPQTNSASPTITTTLHQPALASPGVFATTKPTIATPTLMSGATTPTGNAPGKQGPQHKTATPKPRLYQQLVQAVFGAGALPDQTLRLSSTIQPSTAAASRTSPSATPTKHTTASSERLSYSSLLARAQPVSGRASGAAASLHQPLINDKGAPAGSMMASHQERLMRLGQDDAATVQALGLQGLSILDWTNDPSSHHDTALTSNGTARVPPPAASGQHLALNNTPQQQQQQQRSPYGGTHSPTFVRPHSTPRPAAAAIASLSISPIEVHFARPRMPIIIPLPGAPMTTPTLRGGSNSEPPIITEYIPRPRVTRSTSTAAATKPPIPSRAAAPETILGHAPIPSQRKQPIGHLSDSPSRVSAPITAAAKEPASAATSSPAVHGENTGGTARRHSPRVAALLAKASSSSSSSPATTLSNAPQASPLPAPGLTAAGMAAGLPATVSTLRGRQSKALSSASLKAPAAQSLHNVKGAGVEVRRGTAGLKGRDATPDLVAVGPITATNTTTVAGDSDEGGEDEEEALRIASMFFPASS